MIESRRPVVPTFVRPDADSSSLSSAKHVSVSVSISDKENSRSASHDVTRNQHQSTVKSKQAPSQSQTQNQSCREREMENDSIKRKILMSSFSQMSDVTEKPVERIKKINAETSSNVSAHVKSVTNSSTSSGSNTAASKTTPTTASRSTASNSSRISDDAGNSNSNNNNSSRSSSSSSSSQGVDSGSSQSSDQRSLNGYNYSDSFSQVDQVGPDQASQPSKRARLMLQAALQPAVVAKKDVSGLLASINASKRSASSVVKGVGAGVGGQMRKKYVCAVCKSVAEEPCAARCGHICCETCWTQWMKRQQSCPCCRAPTTLQQIKKITILKS